MARHQKRTFGEILLAGGGVHEGVSILVRDGNERILMGTCTTVPSTKAGFAKGCLLIKTDGGAGVKAIYENTGTITSCSFDIVGDIAAGEIALADAYLLVGQATGLAAAKAVTGDVTILNTGVTAIGAKKVLKTMIACADTKLLIGQSGGDCLEYALSGDITMSNAGVTAVGAGKVLETMLKIQSGSGLFAARVAIATYDFSVDGGTIGAIDSGITIPDNAIILGGMVDKLTTCTSATDAGTMAIHAEGANDLVTAVAISSGTSWDAPGLVDLIPVHTAATAIKCTAARNITFTIAVEDFTAGKFTVAVFYVLTE